jgi:hypothetical protein
VVKIFPWWSSSFQTHPGLSMVKAFHLHNLGKALLNQSLNFSML